MARVTLSEDDRWQLKNRNQDVRGQTVYGTNDQPVGRISRLVANTDSGYVESLVLEDGEQVSASDVDIRDGAVYLKSSRTTEAAAAAGTPDARRPQYADHEEAFRAHFRDAYGETGAEYNAYEPAYRLGYQHGLREEYREKPYDEIEPELRRSYEKKHGADTYADVREASRQAYLRARQHR